METQKSSNLVLGAILVIIGAILLLAQLFNLESGWLWPLIIIGAGGVFFVGMILGGKSTGALAIPGSIISMVGLILLVQNALGWWETWSYAWALIVFAVGVGMFIWGSWSGLHEQRKSGLETARVGLILFLVFGAIMEIIFTLTGVSNRFGLLPWALLLALVGIVQFFYRLIRIIRKTENLRNEDYDLCGPMFLTSIAVLLALYARNIIPSNQIISLLSLWPLLLIGFGIQIIFGRRNAVISFILGLLIAGTLVTLGVFGPQLGITLPDPWRGISIQLPGDGVIEERITGNNIPQPEVRSLGSFDKIELAGIGRLEITQGAQQDLIIQADSNVLPYLTSEVRGNTLVLGIKPRTGITPRTPVVFQVTVPALVTIELSGAGEIYVDKLEATAIKIISSGLGDIEIGELDASDVDILLKAAGKVSIAGRANVVDASISGSGSIDAPQFTTEKAKIRISGLGSVTMRITNSLDAGISGAGSISYYGNPTVKESISGLGNINKKGD